MTIVRSLIAAQIADGVKRAGGGHDLVDRRPVAELGHRGAIVAVVVVAGVIAQVKAGVVGDVPGDVQPAQHVHLADQPRRQRPSSSRSAPVTASSVRWPSSRGQRSGRDGVPGRRRRLARQHGRIGEEVGVPAAAVVGADPEQPRARRAWPRCADALQQRRQERDRQRETARSAQDLTRVIPGGDCPSAVLSSLERSMFEGRRRVDRLQHVDQWPPPSKFLRIISSEHPSSDRSSNRPNV